MGGAAAVGVTSAVSTYGWQGSINRIFPHRLMKRAMAAAHNESTTKTMPSSSARTRVPLVLTKPRDVKLAINRINRDQNCFVQDLSFFNFLFESSFSTNRNFISNLFYLATIQNCFCNASRNDLKILRLSSALKIKRNQSAFMYYSSNFCFVRDTKIFACMLILQMPQCFYTTLFFIIM